MKRKQRYRMDLADELMFWLNTLDLSKNEEEMLDPVELKSLFYKKLMQVR